MKRFTKALLTFACAASIVIGIPTCAYADEQEKPNVISSIMKLNDDQKWDYWRGQNDAAKISNVKVTDVEAHTAKVSFDYELFNVKDLKRLAFIVSVRKYSKIMVTKGSLLGYSLSAEAGDVDPPDKKESKNEEDKKKDTSAEDEYIYKESNIPFFSGEPASGYIRGLDYYSYNLPDKLPTKKKGHAYVIVSTKPATKYTNTQNMGDTTRMIRVEKGETVDPVKPYIDTFSLMRWIANNIYDEDLDRATDIDVNSTYVGIHADYKNGSAIYFNNNAVQVPTFTTLRKDPPSHCSVGKKNNDSSKKDGNSDKNAAENASANDSTMTPLQRAFNRSPVAFMIAIVSAVLLVAIGVVLAVKRSLTKKKRALASKEASEADGDGNSEEDEGDANTAEAGEAETTEAETTEAETEATAEGSEDSVAASGTEGAGSETTGTYGTTETPSISDQPEA